MIIEESDFKLEMNECNDRFTLSLLYVVNAKDVEKRREEFRFAGYDMTLDTCLNKIVNFRIGRKKDVYTFSEYVASYKEERQNLSKLAELKC